VNSVSVCACAYTPRKRIAQTSCGKKMINKKMLFVGFVLVSDSRGCAWLGRSCSFSSFPVWGVGVGSRGRFAAPRGAAAAGASLHSRFSICSEQIPAAITRNFFNISANFYGPFCKFFFCSVHPVQFSYCMSIWFWNYPGFSFCRNMARCVR
jgi:hypothetical protein